MISLQQHIEKLVRAQFRELGLDGDFGMIEPSRRPELSDFQCNGAMAAAKVARKAPRVIAEQIAAGLADNKEIARISIDGPGFVNITIADDLINQKINAIIEDDRLGCPLKSNPETIVLDFGGPNIAKALHIGHMRSAILGDCLQRLFRFMGDKVTSDIHLGDWGLPMGMIIGEIYRNHPELKSDPQLIDNFIITIDQLNAIYPQAATRCKQDKQALNQARKITVELQEGRTDYLALWQKISQVSIASLKQDLTNLGVSFDLWHGERTVNERLRTLIPRLRSQDQVIPDDGAMIIPLNNEITRAMPDQSPDSSGATDTSTKDKAKNDMPPVIMVNSAGGFTYSATDIATIAARCEIPDINRIVYVADQRQALHFRQIFAAASKTSLASDVRLEHISFGTINGIDGKPFKTRSGDAMSLSELIARVINAEQALIEQTDLTTGLSSSEKATTASKIGIASLKFADLDKHRSSNYIFDVEQATRFEGRTGPYILYAIVRMKSLLTKAAAMAKHPDSEVIIKTAIERSLCLKLLSLPEVLTQAYSHRAPNILCDFVYDLTQNFSTFYQQHNIIKDNDLKRQSSRLALVSLTARTLELGCDILGMEIPHAM